GPVEGRLALPFVVRDRVVEGGEADVELAAHQVLHQVDRIRRGRDLRFDAVLDEESLFASHPQRPVGAAGKDDELDGCGGERERRGERGGREQSGGTPHCTWIFASRTTRAMRAVSERMNASNAAGAIGIASAPRPVSFSRISGEASALSAS